jgi:hypothetical protein
MAASFLRFLLMFFTGESDVALLSKQGLKIVAWDNLFVLRIMLIRGYGCGGCVKLILEMKVRLEGDDGHH